MVISHVHNYLFIELPRTGSTAISRELIENYDGEQILRKHSTYRDFKKRYPDLVGHYFVFSCIRNPLDRVVSFYEKCTNGYYDYILAMKRKNTFYRRFYLLPKLRYIKKKHPSFETFFKRFYLFPYSDWSILDHKSFDYIIRFENLNTDFQSALETIGIKSRRDLPVANKTKEKTKHFEEYFTDSIKKRALFVFGPYLSVWDYRLPTEGDILKNSYFWYELINFFRKIYWIYKF